MDSAFFASASTMSTIHGFALLTNPDAHILILGTMPGKMSLRLGQYYAHPRNLFWKLTAELIGLDASAPYDERVTALLSRGIAVWDVLQLCTRESSLDSDIDNSSVVPNDFTRYFSAHPNVRRVCFNGAKAAALFQKHVEPTLAHESARLEYLQLPSTSPANAGVSYETKLRAWRSALE